MSFTNADLMYASSSDRIISLLPYFTKMKSKKKRIRLRNTRKPENRLSPLRESQIYWSVTFVGRLCGDINVTRLAAMR